MSSKYLLSSIPSNYLELGYQILNGRLVSLCDICNEPTINKGPDEKDESVRQWYCISCINNGDRKVGTFKKTLDPSLYSYFGVNKTPIGIQTSLFSVSSLKKPETPSRIRKNFKKEKPIVFHDVKPIKKEPIQLSEKTSEAFLLLDMAGCDIEWTEWKNDLWATAKQVVDFFGFADSTAVSHAIKSYGLVDNGTAIKLTKDLYSDFAPISKTNVKTYCNLISAYGVLTIGLKGASIKAQEIQAKYNEHHQAKTETKNIKPKENPAIQQATNLVTQPHLISTAYDADTLCLSRNERDKTIQGIQTEQATQVIGSVKDLFWAQWNNGQWLTVQQLADFLGVDTITIRGSLKKFRSEFRDECIKVTDESLKHLKSEVPRWSKQRGQKPVIHPRSSSANIFSPQGVLRMCMISDSPVARQVRTAIIAFLGKVPEMVESSALAARKAEIVPANNVAELVITEQLNQLNTIANEVKQIGNQLISNVPTTHAINEYSFLEIDKINQACLDCELPIAFGPNNIPNWLVWDGKETVRIPRPLLYMAFIDLYRQGRLTHVFSIGEGGLSTGRVSPNHERIKMLVEHQYTFRVLWLPLEQAGLQIESERKKVESKLQNIIIPLWDKAWNIPYKKQFREGLL